VGREEAKDDGYIRFRCRSCGQRLKVKRDREGGEVVPCPSCGEPVNVPLANLDAIAQSADMPETGQPGRININPELLMKRLKGEDEERTGPGSVGGPPTLRQGAWSPQTAFGRIQELDQFVAALVKVDQDLMGQIQRIYRNTELTAADREQQFREAGESHKKDIAGLLANRLGAMQGHIQVLQAKGRLSSSEREHLDRLERSHEALRFYGQFVLGIEG